MHLLYHCSETQIVKFKRERELTIACLLFSKIWCLFPDDQIVQGVVDGKQPVILEDIPKEES